MQDEDSYYTGLINYLYYCDCGFPYYNCSIMSVDQAKFLLCNSWNLFVKSCRSKHFFARQGDQVRAMEATEYER